MKYDKKINEEYFSYNNMKALFRSFFSLQSYSSVHVKNITIVSIFLFLFTLMSILIVFMGNITPKIFNY